MQNSVIELFDVHSHLQDNRIRPDLDTIVKRAIERGVCKIVCCGITEKDWDEVYAISLKYPIVIPSFGIHPWYLDNRSSDWLDKLEEMLIKVPTAGVGEIGLDHAVKEFDKHEQHTVFIDQLMLAKRLNRPANMHCRKAWPTLLDAVDRFGIPEVGALVHSYSGGTGVISQVQKAGLHVSFSGSITRDKNKRGRDAAKVVSLDRLLIETDAPDIIPFGVESLVNEPANVYQTAEALAKIRGLTIEEIGEVTSANAKRLFCR